MNWLRSLVGGVLSWLRGGQPAPIPPPAPPVVPTPPTTPTAKVDWVNVQLLYGTNKLRRDFSSTLLDLDESLRQAAQHHAEWMADHQVLSHEEADEPPARHLGDRLTLYGVHFQAAGENVADGQPDVDSVLAAWATSGPHMANMINRTYRLVGFGVALSKPGVHYWCAVFATKFPRAFTGRAVSLGDKDSRLITLSGPIVKKARR